MMTLYLYESCIEDIMRLDEEIEIMLNRPLSVAVRELGLPPTYEALHERLLKAAGERRSAASCLNVADNQLLTINMYHNGEE